MYRHPPSPTHRPTQGKDEARLPQGECRYLLLHPELRGQRCACVTFSLNKSTPGSSCECGHGACYHLAAKEERSTDREEIEALKQKIQRLEDLLEQERYGTRNSLAARLSDLEDVVDRYRTEAGTEVKTAYRGLEGLWHHVGTLQRRARSYDDRIDALLDANQAIQDDVRVLQKRVIEIDDSSMLLEERLDAFETPENPIYEDQPTSSSVYRAAEYSLELGVNPTKHAESLNMLPKLEESKDLSLLQVEPLKDVAVTKAWTVHVSLLPTASQPFPFEKDTAAYSRCVSRGLHRRVTIPGPESKDFTTKISEEFSSLLKGRPWMPLVAKLCDAEHLTGLPMLKQLPVAHVNENLYDLGFLKRNCAVLDTNGSVLDLYIAMCEKTFSWLELQHSQVFRSNLEECWDHDPRLDGHRLDDDLATCEDTAEDSPTIDDVPSAGDILLRGWSPPATRLKRTASAVSRTSSFGSTDGESKRARIQRPCVGGGVERVGRRAEAV